jgi:hypothetical protein
MIGHAEWERTAHIHFTGAKAPIFPLRQNNFYFGLWGEIFFCAFAIIAQKMKYLQLLIKISEHQ